VNACHIAELIDLVAGGAMNGDIQAQSEAEMDVAIGRLGP
jgi:hypothetical protein